LPYCTGLLIKKVNRQDNIKGVIMAHDESDLKTKLAAKLAFDVTTTNDSGCTVAALGTGTLDLGNHDALQSLRAVTLVNDYRISNSSSLTGTHDLTLNGTGNLNNHTLTISNTATTTLNGVVDGYGGSIVLNSIGGRLVLSNANTYGGYGGGMTLRNGTLIVNHNLALGLGVLELSGGTLQQTTGGSITLANPFVVERPSCIGGACNLSLTGACHINQDLTINNAATTIFLGTLRGRGCLIKENFGTLILAGLHNTYAGSILISSGTLSIPKEGLEGYSGHLVIRDVGTFMVTNSSNNSIFTVQGSIEISFKALREALSTESEKSLASMSRKDSHELLARYSAPDEKRNLEIIHAFAAHPAARAAAASSANAPRHEDTAAGAEEKDKRDREKSHGR
jgi:autotransporter-associated beta strand protein